MYVFTKSCTENRCFFTKGPDIFYKRPRYILQTTPIYFTNDPDIFYPDAPDLSPGLVPASPFWTTQHTRRGINLPLVLRRSINTSVHMPHKKDQTESSSEFNCIHRSVFLPVLRLQTQCFRGRRPDVETSPTSDKTQQKIKNQDQTECRRNTNRIQNKTQ